jgi:hypothetical protein
MKIIRTDTAKTVLTISVGFLVLYLLFHLKWALTVSLIIGLTGILSDYLSKKVVFVWLKLSWILSLIVPNIILTVVFFLFLFPIAILSRIFGQKDTLKLRHTSGSLFKDYNKQFDKASFERPW